MKPQTYHHLGPDGWHHHEGPLRPAGTLITFARTAERASENPLEYAISYDISWRDPAASTDDINTLLDEWPRENRLTLGTVSWEAVR